MEVKKTIKKEKNEKKELKLFIPRMLPVNDRIICQLIPKDYFKTESGLVLPLGYDINATNRQRENTNPYSKYYFIVVRYSKNIHKVFPLPSVYDNVKKTFVQTKLEIGDSIIMSENMAPIRLVEDGKFYVIMHYLDILAVEKNIFNLNFDNTSK
jgi:co-chaperonin GroES (HSP10)